MFKAITRRAGLRFEACDWRRMQADALKRLELYKKIVDQNVAQVRQILGGQLKDRSLWSQMQANYSDLIGCCSDGVLLDAVLLDEDEISIVFSFTRSYFHVDVEYLHAVIGLRCSPCPLTIWSSRSSKIASTRRKLPRSRK